MPQKAALDPEYDVVAGGVKETKLWPLLLSALLGLTVPFYFNYELGWLSKAVLTGLLFLGNSNVNNFRGFVLGFLFNIFFPANSSTLYWYHGLLSALLLPHIMTRLLQGNMVHIDYLFNFVIQIYPSTLFSYIGLWHILRLLSIMARLVQGNITDMDYFAKSSYAEMQLYCYFGPTLTPFILRQLWTHSLHLCLLGYGLWGIRSLLSKSKRTVAGGIVARLATLHNTRDMNIRGLFLSAYEGIEVSFYRWEVGKARERHPLSEYSKLEHYTYEELTAPGNIRLLRLQQRQFFSPSPPACELIEVALDDAPEYEAVSYTWGTKAPDIPLLVNGSKVYVTAAVNELLYYRRSIFGSELFWIDAVCINQENNVEKSIQLELMTEIYKRSSRVLVWLGPPPAALGETWMLRKVLKALAWPPITPERLPIETAMRTLFQSREEESAAYKVLGKFYSHPWFERIWVVQEVVAGRTVHVMHNGVCIDWYNLSAGVTRLAENRVLRRLLEHNMSPNISVDPTSPAAHGINSPKLVDPVLWNNVRVMDLSRRNFQAAEPPSLATLIGLTRQFQSTVPRDKIFALVGIAQDGNSLLSKPNYADSDESVFIWATCYLLSGESWFRTLTLAGIGLRDQSCLSKSPTCRHTLPSWVPNYHSTQFTSPQTPRSGAVKSRDRKGRVGFPSRGIGLIQLKVVEFDSILSLGSVALSSGYATLPDISFKGVDDDQLLDYISNQSQNLREWYTACRKLLGEHTTRLAKSQELLEQEFWQLCLNTVPPMDGAVAEPVNQRLPFPPDSDKARVIFEFFLLSSADELRGKIGHSLCGVPKNHAMELHAYLTERLSSSVSNTVLCVTTNGSMALVPVFSKLADILVHIRGGYMPTVLRPCGTEGTKSKALLVGVCYVYGVEDVYSGSEWMDKLIA